ncbi:MAG: hypothetical protein RMX99_032305 [Aulosira sp. DedVER01a]|nr:hypothetical protein [Aulosira sp. ZfuVER01]
MGCFLSYQETTILIAIQKFNDIFLGAIAVPTTFDSLPALQQN